MFAHAVRKLKDPFSSHTVTLSGMFEPQLKHNAETITGRKKSVRLKLLLTPLFLSSLLFHSVLKLFRVSWWRCNNFKMILAVRVMSGCQNVSNPLGRGIGFVHVYHKFVRALNLRYRYLRKWQHLASAAPQLPDEECVPSSRWSPAQWVTLEAGRRCIGIRWVMDGKPGWRQMLSNHAWHEFLRICGSACLMNVNRVLVGPVNGSSNPMEQPLRAGKWSVCLNRNVTTQ